MEALATYAGAQSEKAGIGLGANIGPSLQTLQGAWRRLQEHSRIHALAISSPYRSQPLGMDSTNWFVNAVALIQTTLPPEALLHLLLTIEKDFGRIRTPAEPSPQDRSLDLDLLFYAECTMQTNILTLPHPHMAQRLFVLEPLAEIAGDMILAATGQPVRTALDDLRPAARNQAVEKMCWPA